MSDPTRESALIAAMSRHQDGVFRLALSMLRCRADAEDALQEVFLKYYRRAPAFSGEEHEKAWLIRVTVNTCISLLRGPGRRALPLPDDPPCPSPDLPENQGIAALVRQLPSHYAAVIHLYYYEDMPVRQIARVLRVPEGTVQSRLARARNRLKELIGQAEKNESALL